ncbi:heme ABC exporter ATP-binding protein CcmA [Microaerobacter geothermalis]|uniref:heme ABC exporter ATP-binding protein CcmA n=1 Tax=Microaerobacter geothermalis TaxID=674972 RepID=UPI001F273304|nr:heme ABC exporter ATP-binding protein CcmA [Microaerobacter geothermalis]MCF6095161.1 heme ABC exporter ATP-binding protein CcmA [Microaerobacter geothermalis]
MIKIHKLQKKIGERYILKGISQTINKGEFLTILGPNGAGKSTLLKVIGTLTNPTYGVVEVEGIDVKRKPNLVRERIGYLAHHSLLYDHLTAWQNLKYYGKLYGVKELNRRIEESLRLVGLYYVKNDPIASFSRGMVQRLAIARALIHQPSVLLLDEPHTGLDQQANLIFEQVMKDLQKKGCTLLMVTHDFEQALKLSDRIVILSQGLIKMELNPREHSMESLLRVYHEAVEG